MASIAIVSGAPGTGKTTLAAALAAPRERAVHLAADAFFEFVVHLIPPTLPESRAQNATLARAVARAAGAFASDGYDVFLDGVVGPWFVPVYAAELLPAGVPVDYVVLRAGLEATLRRAAERDKRVPDAVIRQMHGAFAELGAFERHAVETTERTPAEVAADVARRLEAGRLRIDLRELAAGAGGGA